METMRVLEIFREPIANGGQESFIMNMYRNIDRDKVQMDFLTPFTCDNRELEKEIISMGGRVYHCDHPFGENNNKVFKECVGRFFKEHHYDTVHFHSGSTYALMEGSKLAAKAGIKNRIIHSHCCGFDNMKYRIIKLLSVPALLKYPTEYFACSEIAAKWKFPKKIIRQKRYRVINNAVDTGKFRYDEEIRKEWRKKLGVEDCFVVGHAGRFNIQKNHSFLLEIFKEIHDRRPDAILVLAGDGELKEDMIKKAESMGISSYVQFLGIRKDIPQLFNAMDIFVLPSFFEGLAVVGVEAQATGLPVYMSDCLSKELPVEKLSNYISLEKSAAEWAEYILKNSQGFKRSDTTEIIVKKKYEIKTAARQLQDYYLGLMEGKKI